MHGVKKVIFFMRNVTYFLKNDLNVFLIHII